MATRGRKRSASRSVDDYRHEESTRVNNPPAGLAWQDTEPAPRSRFAFDPHQDPELVWAGKAERGEVEVDAVSIHVHERLSTEAIIRAVRREPPELTLFEEPDLDRTQAVEFYRHRMGWTNRMVLGDSLVVMASLLERERLAGQVQMIYLDPPYGINYNSNFQARIAERSPKDGSETALTREPEQVQAYRDTWQLGIHSYLTYLRDRLLVSREMLADSGSIFVQIGPDNLHRVRLLLDEVFGAENACAVITVSKTSQVTAKLLPEVSDFLLWYAKEKPLVKYFQLFEERNLLVDDAYRYVEGPDGTRARLTNEEERDIEGTVARGGRIYTLSDATSQGFSPHKTVPFEFGGQTFHPGANRHWLLRVEGMRGLADAGRLVPVGRTLRYLRYLDDFGGVRRTNVWTDTGQAGFAQRKKSYVVETNPKIVERCIAMTTEPGDLVIDPTCGSGTTAWACEKLGRRWITTDTSRVALALARERILTAKYDYYRLRDEARGVDGGFEYRTLTRVTASSVGYGTEPERETLYDQPLVDGGKVRVSGPFTVEALSRYAVNPLQEDVPPEPPDAQAADAQDHVATLLDALRRQGIPRRGAAAVAIERLDPVPGSGAIQAEGAFRDERGEERTFGVSLGPRFGPVTVRQVDDALHDAYGYDLVVFVGFAADPEAQAYVAPGRLGRFNVALVAANPDLLVGDLLKSTSSSQTFRLFAAPEISVADAEEGAVQVEVLGIDAFDAATGEVTSLERDRVAAWFLDQDYDGVVFHVSQAFFPRSGGWESLSRTLKGMVEPELMERLSSFASVPFAPGGHRRVAVRAIDDFGTASEAVRELAP